jgi:hypothetical protein
MGLSMIYSPFHTVSSPVETLLLWKHLCTTNGPMVQSQFWLLKELVFPDKEKSFITFDTKEGSDARFSPQSS